MFQVHFAQDIVLTVAIFLFLGIAAWYDAHGTEVPDAMTVPYAMLGVTMAFLHERYIEGIIAFVVIYFILQPYRPKFLKRLNNWLVKRSYKEDADQEQEDIQANEEAARAFGQKNDALFDKILTALYIIVPIIFALAGVYDKWPLGSIGASVLIVGAMYAYFIFIWLSSQKEPPPNDEEAEISAFGGADVLVFAGMFAFYGLIPWVYGLVVTLVGYLIWVLLKRVRTKKRIIGAALLPSIFVMSPVRLYLAVVVCQPIIEAFNSLTL